MELFDAHAIGKRVAAFRKLNGQTATEVAEAGGEPLTRQVVTNIETGRKTDIPIRHLVSLAVGLGVPPVALLFDLHYPKEPTGLFLGVHGKEFSVEDAIAWFGGVERGFDPNWSAARLSVREKLLAISDYQRWASEFAARSIQARQYEHQRSLAQRGDNDATWDDQDAEMLAYFIEARDTAEEQRAIAQERCMRLGIEL